MLASPAWAAAYQVHIDITTAFYIHNEAWVIQQETLTSSYTVEFDDDQVKRWLQQDINDRNVAEGMRFDRTDTVTVTLVSLRDFKPTSKRRTLTVMRNSGPEEPSGPTAFQLADGMYVEIDAALTSMIKAFAQDWHEWRAAETDFTWTVGPVTCSSDGSVGTCRLEIAGQAVR